MIRVEHTSVKVILRVPPSRCCAFVGNLVNTCNAMVLQTLNPSCIISMHGRRGTKISLELQWPRAAYWPYFYCRICVGCLSFFLFFVCSLLLWGGGREDKVQSSVAYLGYNDLTLVLEEAEILVVLLNQTIVTLLLVLLLASVLWANIWLV